MSVESYPNNSTMPGDLYYLKDDTIFNPRDVLVSTGTTTENKIEVDKMGASYTPNDVIGVCGVAIDDEYTNRHECTILVNGPAFVKVAGDVEANDLLMGASNARTEYFSGDGTAQQQIVVDNVPIASMVSVIETGGPTTLTKVTGTPTSNEYSVNLTTGVITIGGTSVSGSDNYEVKYNLSDGRLEKLVEMVEETLTVTTHKATLTHIPQFVEIVYASTGTTTGGCTPIPAGETPATTEVAVDHANKELTFATGDAVTQCKVRYRTNYKACAIALEKKSAGEIAKIFFRGVG